MDISTRAPRPLGAIVAELAALCAAGANGILYVITDTQRQVRIGLAAGHVTSLALLGSKGAAALEQLRQVRSGRCRFEACEPPPPQSDLPPTPALLGRLRGEDAIPAPPPAPAPAPVAPPAVPPAPSAEPASATAPGARRLAAAPPAPEPDWAVVEAELAELIGPMAGFVVEDARRAGGDAALVLTRIAQDIGDAALAARFRARVQQRCGL